MATLCENLGASKVRRMLTNEIMGDSSGSATVKDLTVQAQERIVIKPNGGSGSHATKIVNVIGDTNITGKLTVGEFTFSGTPKIQDLTFNNSAIATTNNVMSLSAAQSVRVEDVVFTDNQMAPATDVNLVLAAGATSSVLVEGVKLTDNTVSTSSGTLALTAESGTVQVESVTFTDGVVSTASGPLELTSAAGTVQIEDVIFTNSALTIDGDADFSLTAGATKSVIIENVKVKDNAIDTSSGALTLASAAGTVQVENVIFTDSALTASADADISLTAGATHSVVLENVKITDNAVDTTSGALTLASAAGTVQVENVIFTDSALTVSADADLSLTAGATSAVQVENVRFMDSAVTTSAGTLSLTSHNGDVDIEDVTITNQTISTDQNVLALDAVVSVDVKKDLVLTSTAGGSGKVTTSAGNLELAPAGGVVKIVGELQVDGAINSITTTETNLRIEDKTVTLGTGATDNTKSNGGGVIVAGNPAYAPRAITWNMGAGEASQEKGDFTGSYWHVEGGQLMFSRTIASAERLAPGTNVKLSELASGSDTYRWEFSASKDSTVGAPTASFAGNGSVAGGVLKLSGSQFDQVQNLGITGTFSLVMKVMPQFDLATLTLLTDLLMYGYIQVQVAAGGYLAFSDGANAAIVTNTPMHADPFVLCITVSGTEVKFYVDGALAASSANGLLGPNPALVLNGGYVGEVWYDDVRFVAGQALTAANTMLYGWREMYAAPEIVTYGFRIADDESMQLVKVRGSGATSRVLARPAPNTITASNSMGTVGDSRVSVLLESLN